MTAYKQIPEYRKLPAPQFFEEIAPEQQPVVIRGFTQHWPLVAAAQKTPHDFAAYLMRFYTGKKARIFVAPPAANKRFYYNDDMTDVNYMRGEERVDLFLGRLLELMDREIYPAISMQNSLPSEILPGLIDENKSEFFPDVEPRLWVGNEGIVSAHYDGADNIACVVAGRRRFVLFPPEQTGNLYPGPLNFTPAGAPTSMVDLNAPDFVRYPHFKTALANAWSVELEPGDAIFIPMLWWHHVESLEKVNALMNYWWNGSSAKSSTPPSPIDSLNIALLAMRDLTPRQRNAWRHMFDHYLFKQGIDPASYIPEHQQHVLGKLSPEYVRAIKDYFIDKLKK
ncbi:cupin-like domain-containing protein [Cellvibrio japonicus]|uniref:Pass1-related protein n=1 Tax=Cellvibrio japonicus (strain Ueda107) TaxID=498211 RepID=B3PI16_CELJU|nr:cupin-like domain-containing protein [Cellvibrio japonicus]ACE83516.1 Pass1-related protein [Cellvibrio japonicus Ueda107]QEI11068.1 cupin-like domain-containing protein [Cellvibrio japonicus]QEI14643.1 cupin-like domain-containing protein [Cellvibrio japonicus]QEI18222.1 cupin-like domain-containing protein [Cellvibrio japonicus]